MSWDSTWESIFRKQPWGKYPEIELVRFVARNYYKVPDRSRVKILDLGCGPGANTWFIAREGFATYGIDASSTAIDLLKKRFAAEGLHCTTVVGDITTLPFPDNFFDAVTEVECLSCNRLADLAKILQEVHRVLKPGRKFFSQWFGTATHGCGTGIKIEDGTYRHVMEGELVGLGVIHFTTVQELRGLLSAFTSASIERVDRTTDERTHHVEEYITIATK